MIKISFWLKKSDTEQSSLEYITITNPKIAKVENDTWGSCYSCELYLSDIKCNHPPIYRTNPIDAFGLALEIAKVYLLLLLMVVQFLMEKATNLENWKKESLCQNE